MTDNNNNQLNNQLIELKRKKDKYKLQVIELQNQNKILSEQKFVTNNNNYISSIIQPYLNNLVKKKNDK